MVVSEAKPIRLLLVDDHEIVRIGLRTLLSRFPSIDVVGEAGSVAEAMSNSLKHSQAETVMISLRENSGSIRLEIRDDGIGFDPKAIHSSGHGLQNIFARAQTLQAKLKIISQPGAGARVVLDIPRKEAYGSI